MSKIKLPISGLHCASCQTLIEEEVGQLKGVKKMVVDLKANTGEVEFNEQAISLAEIKMKIKELGYEPEKTEHKTKSSVSGFLTGLLIPLVIGLIILVYFLIVKTGAFSLLARLNEANVGYPLIFLIGFLASFHCIGMCGGLVATYTCGIAAKDGGKNKSLLPHIYYNLGRLISYTAVGGILGGIGSFFAISQYFSGTLMILAGIFMLIMTLNLVTNFSWLKKINLRTPELIAKYIFRQKHSNQPKSPLIIGLLTGLMPCGPLQAMEIYALGTGSWLRGALSLFFYALGTIPLMFGLGSLLSIISKNYMKKAMKISAVIVAFLAVLMLWRGLTTLGVTNQAPSDNNVNKESTGNFQTVNMAVTFRGYEPNVLRVKKGVSVRWVIDGSGITGCTSVISLPEYNIRKNLTRGENIIEFTPTQTGEIPFSCGMRMVWGKFIVE